MLSCRQTNSNISHQPLNEREKMKQNLADTCQYMVPNVVRSVGGYYLGTLPAIARHCLEKLPYRINRPIDEIWIAWLWVKQRPGFVSGPDADWPLKIRKKPFERWIRQNWTRLHYSARSLNRRTSARSLG